MVDASRQDEGSEGPSETESSALGLGSTGELVLLPALALALYQAGQRFA